SNDVFFFYYSGHGGASTSNAGIHSVSINSPSPYPNYYDRIWSIYHENAAYMKVHFDMFDLESGYDYVYLGDTDLHDWWYYERYSGYHSPFWSGWIPLLSDNKLYIRMETDYSYTYDGFSIDKYEVETYDGTHFLCSYDSLSNASNYYLDTLLDSKLDSFTCSNKFVVLDSCNSGGMIDEIQEIGRYVMTACKHDESSLEDPNLKHGVFTNYFLKSNSEAQDINNDGQISIEEMYEYISPNTISYSNSLGYSHHPQQYDGIIGESILNTDVANLNLTIIGNKLEYNFTLFGIGNILKLQIIVCDILENCNYKIKDLLLEPSSSSGFGSYDGNILLENSETINGYGFFVEINSSSLFRFNTSVSEDSDDDSISDIIEIMNGMNPISEDSDGDGLSDGFEFNTSSSPTDRDSDDDTLSDGDEILIYKTDPMNPDTDGDGFSDGFEVNYGTDPLDIKFTPITILLNWVGLAIIITFITTSSITFVKNNQKNKKIRSIRSFELKSESSSFESLNVQKIEKPKPKQYTTLRAPYSGKERLRPNAFSYTNYNYELQKTQLKDIIKYRMPPPNPRNSEAGIKSMLIATKGIELKKQGKIQESYNYLIKALILGVPEPLNSQIKSHLLYIIDETKNLTLTNQSHIPPQSTETNKIKCLKCGTSTGRTSKFCTNCGSKMIQLENSVQDQYEQSEDYKICDTCQHKNPKKNKFCTNCGGIL
ncbi:MAG: hypothetical protein EU548_05835, partial [Promethearchaeota archaeon]